MLRFSGLLQPLEWAALDRFFRLRPWEAPDARIAIVAIDEVDLQQVGQWPLSDRVVAELLQKVSVGKPRVIGLDIYRDLPVPPGQQALRQALTTIDNLVGIEQLGDRSNIAPAPLLDRLNRVGFNNVVLDADGRVRRGLLYWSTPIKLHESFDLKLALTYLQAEAIAPPSAKNNFQALQLGQAVFRRFQPHDGGYVGADAGGYQILANFRHPSTNFLRVPMRDVLADRVPSEIFRDRIVIIGSTAPSLKDFFYTPDSASPLWGAAQPIAGVELHANFVSQIVSAALGERPLIRVWSDFWESAWIVAWIVVAGSLSCRWQIVYSSIYVLLAALGLISIAFLAFLQGWWLPLVPPLLAIFAVSGLMIACNAQLQEEFKRSKDFLQGIIDTIPDPIFVKDKKHRWIVLNEAYCQLIGYPLAELIDRSESDFFSRQEAEVFRQQDELVFHTGTTMEHEEEFSDAGGTTHLISTKRSRHRDAVGNLYLVGIIRDITARKRLEEELKRQTADLVQYNTELRLSEQKLRHLALHDPLTGLPNRQLFLEHLNQSIAWAQNHQLLVGLLYIDLDGFKQVNDTLGHDWGDRLLVAVSQRLSGCLRHSDIVSRLGGDEFTVILRAIPEVSVAERVATKILATLSEVFVFKERVLSITASVGIGIYPLHCDTIDTLIKQADTAMYQAKQQGKNCYQIATVPSQANLY